MIELIVFCSGALVMVLEMTGSRIFAPHLGTSVIVWTSLIGVVLAFLAFGGWLGGRLADKNPSARTLSAILAAAGAGAGLTALLHPVVGATVAASVDSLHLATILVAAILFGLPATLFGMVSPYCIRLRLEKVVTAGKVVGRLYALSTAGSIVGTFLGGFVLISWFGSTTILYGVAAFMLGLSLLAWSGARVLRLALLIALLVGAAVSGLRSGPVLANGLPSLIETPYNVLVLAEGTFGGRTVRTLATDPGKVQSAAFMDDPNELASEYTQFYDLGAALVPGAKRLLMLGGGGYAVPRWVLAGKAGLDPAGLTFDVVELDPGISRAAKDYFGLPAHPGLRLIHEDARRFLNTNTATYDLVFVDVFGSWYSIPFHVATSQSVARMRQAVAPGGALIMNVIASLEGPSSPVFQAIHGALNEHFAQVLTFAVHSRFRRDMVQNIMIVALPERREHLVPEQLPLPLRHRLNTFMEQRADPLVAHAVPPLRDDFAPVERYMLPLLEKANR